MTNVDRAITCFSDAYRRQNRKDALLAISVLLGEFFDEYSSVGEMTDSANMIVTSLMSCTFRKGLRETSDN